MLSLNFVRKRESDSVKERDGPFFIVIILFGTGSEKKSQFFAL